MLEGNSNSIEGTSILILEDWSHAFHFLFDKEIYTSALPVVGYSRKWLHSSLVTAENDSYFLYV